MLAAVEWSNGIEDAWRDVASFVPKALGFLVILFVGYLIAKAVAKLLDAVLERAGFDNLVERGGVRQALARTSMDASDIVSKIAFWAMFLVVLQMAFGVFGTNPVSDMITGVVAFLPKLFAAIVIVVVAAALAAAAREIIDASIGGLSYGKTVASAAGIGIITIGFFAALNQIEIAPEIVNGLFYAALAIVVGSSVIAIGGSGIKPLQAKWEQALQRGSEEYQNMQTEMQGARQRVDERFEDRVEEARRYAQDLPPSSPREHNLDDVHALESDTVTGPARANLRRSDPRRPLRAPSDTELDTGSIPRTPRSR